ncbi:hypothetical protein EU527_11520 [Candidatus Thorarchaeota archaeon]|nr:MAG: hypothetical protein EU527_11520 [Candidatus Thorarchaeota archaeon]
MEQQKLVVAFSVMIIIIFSTTSIVLYFGITDNNESLNFFVFGDSQGYQGSVEQIISTANILRPNFLFHCGDLTPFGQEIQYQEIKTILDTSLVPVYTTIGNHDIKGGGSELYTEYFGSSTYSFNLGPAHFSIFNSSAGDVTEIEISWLERDLSESNAEYKFVFTHIPPFDPRPEHDHSLLNATTSSRLMALFELKRVDVVFTGHIHMYNESIVNGVRYVITGGAGASLYADEEAGGIYHYMDVTLDDSGLSIEPVLLEAPSISRDRVVIRGAVEDITFSLEDLSQLPSIQGYSSFQNQYDNWRGQGVYIGILLSNLVELVGGMSTTDKLVVKSYDGYSQEFRHSNIYPNASWVEIQGPIILAYAYNDTFVLDWADGMRIVMLPPDGAYSNDDAIETTESGNVSSAGARWVRFVQILEVIPE